MVAAAVRGATLDIVDDAAKGTPLEEFDMLEQTCAILRKRGIEKLFPIQAETYSKVQFEGIFRAVLGSFCIYVGAHFR